MPDLNNTGEAASHFIGLEPIRQVSFTQQNFSNDQRNDNVNLQNYHQQHAIQPDLHKQNSLFYHEAEKMPASPKILANNSHVINS